MNKVDFIIVGQGIAGSCLAFELIQRGKKVAVVDDDWRDAACLVAAGVINPITGKRLVKSWRSSLAHPYAKNFYSNLEKKLNAKFYHPRKILQLCKSDEERELWNQRLTEPDYSQYIDATFPCGKFSTLKDERGSYEIAHSAWIETRPAMMAFRKFFLDNNCLSIEAFNYADLKVSQNSISYKNIYAEKIIFCDGWRVLQNPYFSWLPYRPAKGEILTIKSFKQLPEHVIHKGNWIMKFGSDSFRIGSTWDRENLNSLPTPSAKNELLKAVPNIIKDFSDCEVIEHSAGVRPCTATTRPHLGAHPTFQRVLSFNGFGSKGYALSPYFANHFADYLFGGVLDSEADLKRHVKKFFK